MDNFKKLTKEEKEFIESILDKLISKYGEDSCIEIKYFIEYTACFIEFRFNEEINKFQKRMKIKMTREITYFLCSILNIYLLSSGDLESTDSQKFMYNLKDWKLIMNEYS